MEQSDRYPARERADRVRIFVYACQLPLARLARDAGSLSPHAQLVREDPPFTAASAAVVDALMQVWGKDLFRSAYGQHLMAMLASLGPIDTAEFLLRGANPILSGSAQMIETDVALRAVLAAHPAAFLGAARALLGRFTFRPLDDGSGA
ncbi:MULTISPECIES: hypothetical protein [Burkholderia]|uniref:hypothetical protein n=1 Tax=Burkholderia TaxID=32008 RepID=UPI000F5B1277|nr:MULTISPECIES: hypothetical protein [Burkholderia]MBN3739048.1 transposase [Burkholderia sp. Tr-20355]RQS77400.1 hypothetical protein DF032_20600 [Burkholderia seminalis]